ncbi:response regulator transcription factor [bacterium]|nr:response regulator transcription factor [bacterium]
MDNVRILLIEDNRLLQEGIAAMLDSVEGFGVIARSEDGDAIEQLKKLSTLPDIVLLDLGLEKMDSLDLMAIIQKEIPKCRIIAMEILAENVDIVEFVRAGGHGFILKNAPTSEWIRTIRAVASGEKVLPPAMTHSLFMQIALNTVEKVHALPKDAVRLTPRELEVVKLISEGLSNKEIAETLHIATYTVKSHVHNILEKLALSTRLQIAAYTHSRNS